MDTGPPPPYQPNAPPQQPASNPGFIHEQPQYAPQPQPGYPPPQQQYPPSQQPPSYPPQQQQPYQYPPPKTSQPYEQKYAPGPQPGYQPQPGYPPQPGYQVQPGYYPPSSMSSQNTTNTTTVVVGAVAPQPTTIAYQGEPPPSYMWLSWLVCLFCCWPLGLAAIMASSRVDSAVAVGNYGEAVAQSNRAKSYSIAGFVCGMLIIVLLIVRFTVLVA